jgi:hypothetical protein
LTQPENLCKGTGTLQTGLKILSKSDVVAESAYAGDFNGDRRTEILWMAADGSWKLMSFETNSQSGGTWEVMAHDAGNRVSEWNQGTQESGVSVGRFLAGTSSDVVLTVSRNKSSRQYTYTLRKYNASAGKWDPWFSEKQDHAGKTIGLDTLKPSDTFIPVNVPGGKTAIYRYNRDWRYDLKEIRFNDSTFNILSAVDFHGYDKDQNPKYYESLTLLPGCFLNPATGSVLAFGHVSKVRHYQEILPDFVHLYSLPTNQ